MLIKIKIIRTNPKHKLDPIFMGVEFIQSNRIGKITYMVSVFIRLQVWEWQASAGGSSLNGYHYAQQWQSFRRRSEFLNWICLPYNNMDRIDYTLLYASRQLPKYQKYDVDSDFNILWISFVRSRLFLQAIGFDDDL